MHPFNFLEPIYPQIILGGNDFFLPFFGNLLFTNKIKWLNNFFNQHRLCRLLIAYQNEPGNRMKMKIRTKALDMSMIFNYLT